MRVTIEDAAFYSERYGIVQDAFMERAFGAPRFGEEFLHRIAPIIKEKLIEPMGLEVPHIPIEEAAAELGGALGVTQFHVLANDPIGIKINGWLPYEEAAATLAHEMIHAALPIEEAHGPQFERYARRIGLVGPAMSTLAGPAFLDWYDKNLRHLEEEPDA